MKNKPSQRRYHVIPCPISPDAARSCPHCTSVRSRWSGRIPKATLAALRETEEILAHPAEHPGMTFAEYVAWAHSL